MLSGEPAHHSDDVGGAAEGAPANGRPLPIDVGTWFEREILPHRASLEKYLARCFPNEADLEDVVQQSFERVLARSGDEPIENPKFYLKRTAWSLLQSRIRRRAVASIDYHADLSTFGFQCDAPLPDEKRVYSSKVGICSKVPEIR